MDNIAEICHSKSDEVLVVDEATGGQGVKELTAMVKKQINSLPVLKQTDRNRKISYLVLENPDKRDVMMFTILMVTKLFATAKGKGVVESWQAAVDKMNAQVHKSTCHNLCDPPIAVRTVCWRFENTMKLINEICAAVPSGCDDKESPNSLQLLLEDLYRVKASFEEGQQGQKVSALAQNRWTVRKQRRSKKLQLVSSVACCWKVLKKQTPLQEIQNR
jgi:hypothetical protein